MNDHYLSKTPNLSMEVMLNLYSASLPIPNAAVQLEVACQNA